MTAISIKKSHEQTMRIQDKVVVIAGGASCLGLAAARYLLHEKGARIAILDRSAKAGERVVAELGAEHAMFRQTDVGSEKSVETAIDAVIARFGSIHVCINATANPIDLKAPGGSGKASAMARFAQVISINVNGVFNVMSKCVEQMARNEAEVGEERGVVINVSSDAVYEAQTGQCAYGAADAAILGMNIPAAREVGVMGVRVNAIAPGLFPSTMVSALDERALASLKAQLQAPKRLGDLREFAHCCAFIIENAYINAETIRLDAASRLRAM